MTRPHEPILGTHARRRARTRTRASALAEHAAAESGTTILLLDTQASGAAEALYRRVGWTATGVIPDYAAGPTGVLDPTTPCCKAVT